MVVLVHEFEKFISIAINLHDDILQNTLVYKKKGLALNPL